jgi:hypothetical protein
MSWRTFWQIALLILIYWLMSWAVFWIRDLQAEAAYKARMEQIRNENSQPVSISPSGL